MYRRRIIAALVGFAVLVVGGLAAVVALTGGSAGDDLVRGLVALCESDVHDPVNVGNPDEMGLLEMAQLVVELTGARSEIVFEALPVDDPQVRQPDISRAKHLLGWEPEIDVREGLRRTIEYYTEMLGGPVLP